MPAGSLKGTRMKWNLKCWGKVKKAVKDGLAEDEQKNAEAKLQKIHDKYIKQIDDMLAEKDKEIMTV